MRRPLACGHSAPALLRILPLTQVTIFKKAGLTKFKIRCSKYLYTLCMRDADKVRARGAAGGRHAGAAARARPPAALARTLALFARDALRGCWRGWVGLLFNRRGGVSW